MYPLVLTCRAHPKRGKSIIFILNRLYIYIQNDNKNTVFPSPYLRSSLYIIKINMSAGQAKYHHYDYAVNVATT